MDSDDPPKSEEAGSEPQRLLAARAQFQTRSRPLFTSNNRDSSNYDEMADLNLGIEGTARKRAVFPAAWRLFKPGSAHVGQQRRREEALARCKDARYQMTIKSRKMMEAFKTQDQQASSSDTPDEVSSMDGIETVSSFKAPIDNEATDVDAKFANSLMLPEYLGEIPPDFSSDWCCRSFPSGVRCTVIARGGRTQSRDIDGILLDEFQSLLPCGSVYNTSSTGTASTILDCVLVEHSDEIDSNEKHPIYFVLDLMAWNGKFYYNSSAESRFWMLMNWISDLDGIDRLTKGSNALRNDRRFFCLPLYSTELSDLVLAVKSPQHILFLDCQSAKTNEPEFDVSSTATVLSHSGVKFAPEGVMFYFKDMDYVDEQTPVMCVLPIAAARSLLQTLTQSAPTPS
jgi:hypothetical protein